MIKGEDVEQVLYIGLVDVEGHIPSGECLLRSC